MSDVARDMLRMFGLGMGLSVESNQRLAKARELRKLAELTPVEESEPSRKPSLRVICGEVEGPWVPIASRRSAEPKH